MEYSDLLYKLHKYQKKLDFSPTNIIYQQKVMFYNDLIGGKPKLTTEELNDIFINNFKIININFKTILNDSPNNFIWGISDSPNVKPSETITFDFDTKDSIENNLEGIDKTQYDKFKEIYINKFTQFLKKQNKQNTDTATLTLKIKTIISKHLKYFNKYSKENLKLLWLKKIDENDIDKFVISCYRLNRFHNQKYIYKLIIIFDYNVNDIVDDTESSKVWILKRNIDYIFEPKKFQCLQDDKDYHLHKIKFHSFSINIKDTEIPILHFNINNYLCHNGIREKRDYIGFVDTDISTLIRIKGVHLIGLLYFKHFYYYPYGEMGAINYYNKKLLPPFEKEDFKSYVENSIFNPKHINNPDHKKYLLPE